MLLVLAVAATPEYRDFISAGTYILGTLITVLGGIQVALITSARGQAKKAADSAAPTGNGFAGEMRTLVKEFRAFRDDSTKRDDFQNQLLIGIDQRVTNLEENQ